MDNNNNLKKFFDNVLNNEAFETIIKDVIREHETNLLALLSDAEKYERKYIAPNWKGSKIVNGKRYGYNQWLRDEYPQWVNFKTQIINTNLETAPPLVELFPFKKDFVNAPAFLMQFYNVAENIEFITNRFERNTPKATKTANGMFVSNPHNLTARAKIFYNDTVALFYKETMCNIYEKPPHQYPNLFDNHVKLLIEQCNKCINTIDKDKEYYFNIITEPYNANIKAPTHPNWYEIIYNSLERAKQATELYLNTGEETLNLEDCETEKTKTELLHEKLIKYGFYKIESVKNLSSESKKELLNTLSRHGLPYSIAMFEILNYLTFLKNEYFPIQKDLEKNISKWFGLKDADGRQTRGNINVLKKYSTEDKTRFTAHLHKETVIKDYNKLK